MHARAECVRISVSDAPCKHMEWGGVMWCATPKHNRINRSNRLPTPPPLLPSGRGYRWAVCYIVQRRLGLQWGQSSNRQWHKALELHCTGTEGAPIHLNVMNNGWRGEVRMMHFVKSHSGLLTHQSHQRAPPVLYLFQPSDEIWPPEETVIMYFFKGKMKDELTFFIVSFKPDIFLILTLKGSLIAPEWSSSTELFSLF